MDSQRNGRGPLLPREAEARLRARVRRVSLLWWAATYLVLCLFNFTTEPQKAWPTDLVGYAGGSLAGLGWSRLVLRRLLYARGCLRYEAVWEGMGLAALGGSVCGAIAGVLELGVAKYLNLDISVEAQIAAFVVSVGHYAELCVGWVFIYLVISGVERLARIDEEVSALRVVAYNSESALFRSEFEFTFMQTVFSELEELLSLRKQRESQDVVVSVAAKVRGVLDQWPDPAGRADCAELTALKSKWGDANFSESDIVINSVMNLRIANLIYWIAIFIFFLVTDLSFFLVVDGRRILWDLVCRFAFCVTGYLACAALEPVSRFLSARRWWEKCAWAAVFSIAASYISAWGPWAVWWLDNHRFPSLEILLDYAFYYGCAYAAWYCLYFYAQTVRREVTQRAVLAQAAEAAAAARNCMLRYQVRPHFLFNALNALFALIADRRWAAARAMTRALSQYFERSFAEDERELVPVGEQVEALQAYLSIEKIRFGDRLRFRADIPERLAGACAPSLILHPLVENAMKYAVAATAEPVEVEIAADCEGDTLTLLVRDSGGDPEAMAAPGLGIGLRNVAARLASHYGERGLLQCKRLTPKGFVAEMRLPLEFACPAFAA